MTVSSASQMQPSPYRSATGAEKRHPHVAVLSAFALDLIGPVHGALVEDHLKACRPCAHDVLGVRTLATRPRSASDSPPSHVWWRILAEVRNRSADAED